MLDALKLDLQKLRIKSFEFQSQTFRVLMPLAGEVDAIMARIKEPSSALIDHAMKDLKDSNEEAKAEVVHKAASTASYILEAWSLLCNEAGERVKTTYEEIVECVPFAVQIEVAKRVLDLLQPNWDDERKN